MEKQTAGRRQLGTFAPKFAELNDDILFDQIWAREEELSPRDRSMITVCVLMAKGIIDNSLKVHITNAKKAWNQSGGNGGDSDSCSFLCGVAECLGSIPYCKGGVRG